MSDDNDNGAPGKKLTRREMAKASGIAIGLAGLPAIAAAQISPSTRLREGAVRFETKRLKIADAANLVGTKTIASFNRFVAGPDPKKSITVHELTGLSGGRAVASFNRFVQSGSKVVAEQKQTQSFDQIRTVNDFDNLDIKLKNTAKFKTEL